MLRSGKLLEKQKGFTVPDSGSNATTRYQGQAANGYLRYRNARTGSYSFGFTLEKDAGEKFWKWEARKQIFGIDFTSFHAQIMNRGKLKNLIMGDYQVQAGQGMILGAGFSLGKGSEVIRTVYRSTLGIRPYTSVMEANFLRGVAATYAVNPHIDLTAFYSATRRDASQEQVSDEIITTSLPISGYHRTPSEREKHNILAERNAGLHILYKPSSQKGQLGFTLLHTSYHSTIRKRDIPYNRLNFRVNKTSLPVPTATTGGKIFTFLGKLQFPKAVVRVQWPALSPGWERNGTCRCWPDGTRGVFTHSTEIL
jgi:hypothetical protein